VGDVRVGDERVTSTKIVGFLARRKRMLLVRSSTSHILAAETIITRQLASERPAMTLSV
jgi:hypothetical protein